MADPGLSVRGGVLSRGFKRGGCGRGQLQLGGMGESCKLPRWEAPEAFQVSHY